MTKNSLIPTPADIAAKQDPGNNLYFPSFKKIENTTYRAGYTQSELARAELNARMDWEMKLPQLFAEAHKNNGRSINKLDIHNSDREMVNIDKKIIKGLFAEFGWKVDFDTKYIEGYEGTGYNGGEPSREDIYLLIKPLEKQEANNSKLLNREELEAAIISPESSTRSRAYQLLLFREDQSFQPFIKGAIQDLMYNCPHIKDESKLYWLNNLFKIAIVCEMKELGSALRNYVDKLFIQNKVDFKVSSNEAVAIISSLAHFEGKIDHDLAERFKSQFYNYEKEYFDKGVVAIKHVALQP